MTDHPASKTPSTSVPDISGEKSGEKSGPKLTPMFEQYLGIKAEYPDALLFYRMGDFYELFFEDAETAARELQISLTSRNPNAEIKTPMCGVPHHAAEAYLSKLIEKGYKVAICDQIEDPRQAKGLVKRAVTRILTPGTVVEDSNLKAKGHNYLAALLWNEAGNAGGLAWLDVSTGEWTGIQSRQHNTLWQWVGKLRPTELLLAEEYTPPKKNFDQAVQVTRLPFRSFFDPNGARERLLKAQEAANLQVLDLADKTELTQACGALLAYLHQTQKQEMVHLSPFRPLDLSKHLLLDETTERNLELFHTLDGRTGRGCLIHVLDQTMTPMGGRLLEERLRHPWREIRRIEDCLDTVGHFHRREELRKTVREALRRVYDIERLTTRIALNRASPKDFTALRASLACLPHIAALLAQPKTEEDLDKKSDDDPFPTALASAMRHWDNLEDVSELLERALADNPPPVITEGGLFKPGYHPELDEIMELAEHGESRLEKLAARERTASELPKMKLGYNRVFGHYFELPHTLADKVPEHFIRRQTLANNERYVTPELKELEEKLLSAVDRQKSLEYDLFLQLRVDVDKERERLTLMAGILAGLDYWQGLAEAAQRWNWSRPVPHEGIETLVTGGRHPVVEAVQGAADFIPNDISLDEERHILLITGPNMAGKSTVLRQTAIICLMAQMGSFVPAKSARLGITDRIFCRVGASDNLAQGQSTFMVEMTETARILRQAGKRSLVILDEIGRGTSTFDGLALAWAVVEELARRGQGVLRVLFATHYHELTALEGVTPGVRNMNIAVKEWGGDILFLRRLVPGPSDRSYGIEVARLAGVPRTVVQRAREILGELEKKARETEARAPIPSARQTLLPGMDSPPPTLSMESGVPKSIEPHPLLLELAGVSPDTMTPMEALNLVSRWKATWGEQNDEDK